MEQNTEEKEPGVIEYAIVLVLTFVVTMILLPIVKAKQMKEKMQKSKAKVIGAVLLALLIGAYWFFLK